MVKLYKRIDNDLFYAECWVSGAAAVTHWGIAGNSGKMKKEACADGECLINALNEELAKPVIKSAAEKTGAMKYSILISYE